MSATEEPSLWVRPRIAEHGPRRAAGGFYRTAERKGQPGVGGVPLVDADDAVVAAVRLAYKVAAAQVDRSTRLANRLRRAGKRAAGANSDRDAVDAAESLVFRTMLGGLSWIESVAADRESPIKRLLAAEYRMIGSMLGLPVTERPTDKARADKAGKKAARDPGRAGPAPAEEWNVPTRSRSLTVRHTGQHRRAVRVLDCDLGSVTTPEAEIRFYNLEHGGGSIAARLTVASRRDATLEIATPASAKPGLWRAAVCLEDGTQVGSIDLEL